MLSVSLESTRTNGTLLTRSVGKATGNEKASMAYVNFHERIVAKHMVRLVGWPDDMKFVAPGNSGASLNDFLNLLKLVQSGDLRFEKITEEELRVLDQENQEAIREGRVAAPKTRKRRSDAGQPRKDTEPRKRRKTAKGRQNIEREEDDEDDEEDDDGEDEGTRRNSDGRRQRRVCSNARIEESDAE